VFVNQLDQVLKMPEH